MYAMIHDVVVHPDYRGQGLGAQLIRSLTDDLQARAHASFGGAEIEQTNGTWLSKTEDATLFTWNGGAIRLESTQDSLLNTVLGEIERSASQPGLQPKMAMVARLEPRGFSTRLQVQTKAWMLVLTVQIDVPESARRDADTLLFAISAAKTSPDLALGAVPSRARGFVEHALEALSIDDQSDRITMRTSFQSQQLLEAF